MPLMNQDDISQIDGSGEDVRRTLAQRIAHRNRQRAERLAGLHLIPRSADAGVTSDPKRPAPAVVPINASVTRTPIRRDFDGSRSAFEGGGSSAALNDFIDTLQDGLSGVAVPPNGVMRFDGAEKSEPPVEAPAAAFPVCDLDRLTGAGPGLIWALQRTGIGSLGDMATLDPADLIDRLGILGRMIPAETWIRTARAATGQEPQPG